MLPQRQKINRFLNIYRSGELNAIVAQTGKELQSMNTFIDKHYHGKCHNGNNFIYDIKGTGLGACIEIKCPKCGESEDITDEDKF